MTYEEWEQTVPDTICNDVLWKVKAYRLSLFLAELSWHDGASMTKNAQLTSVADQLVRACGKIGASIAEGYSRGTGRDRARFYEYSLGSLREARHWYYQGRFRLTAEVLEHRLELIQQTIRLLLSMITADRKLQRKFESED